jgi:hypothetical protein
LGDKRGKGLFTRLQVRGKSFWGYFVAAGSAALFPKQESNCNEEFKQDGLLMLEFSNSQSRKEFTRQ